MFADFLTRLLAPAPETLPDADARLALSALMVRLARSDGDYAASERARITDILAARYGLGQAEAEALQGDDAILTWATDANAAAARAREAAEAPAPAPAPSVEDAAAGWAAEAGRAVDARRPFVRSA